LFAEFEQLDLDESIIQRSIRLRQQVRLTLGDAIIAATAIENDCDLWTANTEDFARVDRIYRTNSIDLTRSSAGVAPNDFPTATAFKTTSLLLTMDLLS
jgi:hypothetical protein